MDLLTELVKQINGKLFVITMQVLLTSAVALYLKDLSSRFVNFIKMRFSDFGRGTKVEFGGKIGHITKVTFGNVEIRLDDESLMIVPIARFLSMPKIIYTNIPDRDQDK